MRKLMIAGALAITLGLAGAQQAKAQDMVGAKAGLVSANLDDSGADARTSFGFGAFARFPVGDAWTMQPEVLYMPKGFTTEQEGVDATWSLNYIQVPVLVQYHFPVEGSVAPRLFAGPALAVEAGCDISGSDGGTSASIACSDFDEFGLDLETKSFEYGLVFGGGIDFAAGSATVTLDGRYDMGLSDVLEAEGVSDGQNQAWAFFAGVGFPVGR